jgi:DNA replication protein DnaC
MDDEERRIDPADEARRKKRETPLVELAADIVDAIPKLTDEEWKVRDAEAAAAMAAYREVEARTNRRQDLDKYGWPIGIVKIAREPAPTLAIEMLLAHDFREKSMVVFGGTTGVGKTIAAGVWAMRQPTITRFVKATKFAASSRFNEEQRAEWFNASALVLDDLGAEYIDTKGSFLSDLDALVDAFYDSQRPLIITTNCTDAMLQQRYGARVIDRLVGAAEIMAVPGASLRGRKL